jgi:hypothetical protein
VVRRPRTPARSGSRPGRPRASAPSRPARHRPQAGPPAPGTSRPACRTRGPRRRRSRPRTDRPPGGPLGQAQSDPVEAPHAGQEGGRQLGEVAGRRGPEQEVGVGAGDRRHLLGRDAEPGGIGPVEVHLGHARQCAVGGPPVRRGAGRRAGGDRDPGAARRARPRLPRRGARQGPRAPRRTAMTVGSPACSGIAGSGSSDPRGRRGCRQTSATARAGAASFRCS